MQNQILSNKPYFSEDHSKEIIQHGFTYIEGKKLKTELNISNEDIHAFQSHWDDLKLDNYMNDGGNYRYRRYSQLNRLSQDTTFRLLPHEPYAQPSYINALNGDTLRQFEPMGTDFITCKSLNKIVNFIQNIVDDIEGEKASWNIRLHPYRIVTQSTTPGLPTPEGLHRDGVDFICTLMLNRIDITGGITTITDTHKNPLIKIMLEDTLDLVVADDQRTMHDVSPIIPEPTSCKGYRDVLVIAFTRI